MLPSDLEISIAAALKDAKMLVDPLVTVTIAEYHSRPITVSGAVRQPLTFQAEGPTSLLEAIDRAGGVSESAGPEILVTQMQVGTDGKLAPFSRRVSKKGLIDYEDPALNLVLTGGEEVRVPEAAKIYVVGNVKEPSAIKVQDNDQTSVFEALALVKGLTPFYGKVAYVYRVDATGNKTEIAIPLEKILKRKAPDVPLVANDIFYVPDRKGQRIIMTVAGKNRDVRQHRGRHGAHLQQVDFSKANSTMEQKDNLALPAPRQEALLPALPSKCVPRPPAAGAEPDSDESAVSLTHYLWVLRRHVWRIIAFVTTAVVATIIVSSRLTPIYESTATIDVDRQAPSGVVGRCGCRPAVRLRRGPVPGYPDPAHSVRCCSAASGAAFQAERISGSHAGKAGHASVHP